MQQQIPPALVAKSGSREPQLPAPEVLLTEAITLHQQGKWTEAERLYRELLTLNPADADVLHLLGVMALQKGAPQEAIELLAQAVRISPAYLDAHVSLAFALQDQGMHLQALASFVRALGIKPDMPDVLNRRGTTLSALHRYEEALQSHEQALALKPAFPEAHCNRGNALVKLGRPDEALQAYVRALTVHPGHIDALNNQGNVLTSLGRYEEAVISYDLAIAAAPAHAEALGNRANALRCMNRNDEALASCELALSLQPQSVGAWINRATILRGLNRTGEALDCYEKALALDPENADAHLNEGLCRLLTGDFERGWRKYEWRWKCTELRLQNREFAQPLWKGDSSLQGKTILLHAEQGFGDSIQFCRYVALVEASGAEVVLEVPAPLFRLMQGLAGERRVISAGDTLPPFDLHCPLLTLPLAFKTELHDIPFAPSYLCVDPSLEIAWKLKLGGKRKFRVGVVWSGRKTHRNDHNRSVPLPGLLPLRSEEVQLFSLNPGVEAADNEFLARNAIATFDGQLADFADTAALISQMDLVISVDTAVSHLAGALGVPIWVMLPFSPDWRWLLDRGDSPWYPSMRLFRQPGVGNWQRVLEEVVHELHDKAAKYRNSDNSLSLG